MPDPVETRTNASTSKPAASKSSPRPSVYRAQQDVQSNQSQATKSSSKQLGTSTKSSIPVSKQAETNPGTTAGKVGRKTPRPPSQPATSKKNSDEALQGSSHPQPATSQGSKLGSSSKPVVKVLQTPGPSDSQAAPATAARSSLQNGSRNTSVVNSSKSSSKGENSEATTTNKEEPTMLKQSRSGRKSTMGHAKQQESSLSSGPGTGGRGREKRSPLATKTVTVTGDKKGATMATNKMGDDVTEFKPRVSLPAHAEATYFIGGGNGVSM